MKDTPLAYWISFDYSPGGSRRSENGRIMAFTIGKVLDTYDTQWVVEEPSFRPRCAEDFADDILSEEAVLVQYTAGDHPGTWSVGHQGSVGELMQLLRWIQRNGLRSGIVEFWMPLDDPYGAALAMNVDLKDRLEEALHPLRVALDVFMESDDPSPCLDVIASVGESITREPCFAFGIEGLDLECPFWMSPLIFDSGAMFHFQQEEGYDPEHMMMLLRRLSKAAKARVSWTRLYKTYLVGVVPSAYDPIARLHRWEDMDDDDWLKLLSKYRRQRLAFK